MHIYFKNIKFDSELVFSRGMVKMYLLIIHDTNLNRSRWENVGLVALLNTFVPIPTHTHTVLENSSKFISSEKYEGIHSD